MRWSLLCQVRSATWSNWTSWPDEPLRERGLRNAVVALGRGGTWCGLAAWISWTSPSRAGSGSRDAAGRDRRSPRHEAVHLDALDVPATRSRDDRGCRRSCGCPSGEPRALPWTGTSLAYGARCDATGLSDHEIERHEVTGAVRHALRLVERVACARCARHVVRVRPPRRHRCRSGRCARAGTRTPAAGTQARCRAGCGARAAPRS